MNAEVLQWEGITDGDVDDVSQGHWESPQDPITGEVLNIWVPGKPIMGATTIPGTSGLITTINCLARGVVDGGIRVAGSTERFGDTYENIEFAKLWTTSKIKLRKNDRITNIRAKRGGTVIWVESDDSPVVFNVNGVSPLFDAFNKHVENFVLLERA